MIFAYTVKFFEDGFEGIIGSEFGLVSASSLSEATSKIENCWYGKLVSVELAYLESRCDSAIIPLESVEKHFNLAN